VAAQSALLKVLEETGIGMFFLFATTEVDKIISTIRSRSLEIHFDRVPESQLVENLKHICQSRGEDLSEKALIAVARRSRGHVRNAHMMLDNLISLGEEDYFRSFRSSGGLIVDYMVSVLSQDRELLYRSMEQLSSFLLVTIKEDYQDVLLGVMRKVVGGGENLPSSKLFTFSSQELVRLVRLMMSSWVLDSFSSDTTFQTALYCVFQMWGGGTEQKSVGHTLLGRAMKK
jgi:DNA polymerase III delta prime subunit